MKSWIGPLLAFLCGAFIGDLHGQPPRSERREISVAGYGFIRIVPQGLEFNVGVESDATTVEAVRRENDTRMNALLKALKDAGVADVDIATSTLSLTKRFTPAEESKTGKEGVSFKLQRDVHVRLRKIAGAEDVMAAALKAGANKLSDFTFMDDKNAEHQEAAIALAIKDAIRTADFQAAQFGAKRGKATWIAEDRNSYQRGGARERVIITGSAIPTAPVSNGEITVDATIFAQFELE